MKPRPLTLLLSLAVVIGLVSCPEAGADTKLEELLASGEVPTRDQIPEKYKWDLADIFPSDEAWEKEYKAVEVDIEGLKRLKGQLSSSPEGLAAALEKSARLGVRFGNVFVYANQNLHTDGENPTFKDRSMRAAGLSTRFREATSWMGPEILTIPEETLRSWFQEDPKLALYAHHLENLIREKQHILDEQGEKILAMSGQMARATNNAYSALLNVDLPFPKIKDEEGREVTLSESRHYMFRRLSDRRVRRDSFVGTMGAYTPYKNTIAALLAGAIHGDIFYAKARGYENSLEAALHGPNIPVEVYRNLVKTINANLPLMHRYAELRKKLLGLDELHIYDLYCPMVSAVDRKYVYDDAVRMCMEGLKPLGPEYLQPVEKAFTSRWIDVYETQNKRSGAYSWGSYGSHPYMLLNFNGTFDAVSTVAHEMGHSMHSYFTYTNQPPIYGHYATFVAEVASTTNEIIMQEYWLKRAATRDEKLYLLDAFIDSVRQTVFRQTMFAEFELTLHEVAERGEALTPEKMAEVSNELWRKYYGPGLVIDDEAAVYFLRIPHFFRGYYVYQYSTSYCAAATLAKDILGGDKNALNAYLGFLKSGDSDYPINILKKAGVDMTTPKPIEDCMARFEMLLDRFEATYNEKP